VLVFTHSPQKLDGRRFDDCQTCERHTLTECDDQRNPAAKRMADDMHLAARFSNDGFQDLRFVGD